MILRYFLFVSYFLLLYSFQGRSVLARAHNALPSRFTAYPVDLVHWALLLSGIRGAPQSASDDARLPRRAGGGRARWVVPCHYRRMEEASAAIAQWWTLRTSIQRSSTPTCAINSDSKALIRIFFKIKLFKYEFLILYNGISCSWLIAKR